MRLHRGLYEHGGKGARTPDLLDAIETLSQLSYAPDSRSFKVPESHAKVKELADITQPKSSMINEQSTKALILGQPRIALSTPGGVGMRTRRFCDRPRHRRMPPFRPFKLTLMPVRRGGVLGRCGRLVGDVPRTNLAADSISATAKTACRFRSDLDCRARYPQS